MPSHLLLARLARLNTGAVSDALDVYGLTGATNGLLPLGHRRKMVGQASTVQLEAIARRKGQSHFLSSAINAIEARDQILVVAGGVDGIACWDGSLNALAARRAILGSVIDGMYREVDDGTADAYPVFGAGLTAISGERRVAHVSSGIPVVVAGVVVHPGDYVIADRCGTVFIPVAMIESVVATAERIFRKKADIAAALQAGQPLLRLMPEQQLDAVCKPSIKNTWGKFRI
ncbi:RraA family protein [Herbaspirillum rhizosphaerae]|uniref:RraA family protein n=1 Tax=Herbaspirillum rhizosphaerae TaxID=346179 RepID=UPI00067C0DA3|nr:hypothetical protein [Herbaspirillum rhizosphaerae]